MQILAVMSAMGLLLVLLVCGGFYWGNESVKKTNAQQFAELLVGTLIIAAQINGDDANLIRITTAVGANPSVQFIALVDPTTNTVVAATQNELIGRLARDERILTVGVGQQKLHLQSNNKDSFAFAQRIQVFSPAQQKIRNLHLHLLLDAASASTLFSKMLFVLFIILLLMLTGFAVFIFYFLRLKLFYGILSLRFSMTEYMRKHATNSVMPNGLNELQQLQWSYKALISTRDNFERELVLERDKAETANRAKTVFISNMSHQLRTPLNSIIGFSQHLVRLYRGKDERLEKSLDSIHASGHSLLKFVNYILDFSKIDAGELMLDLKPVNALDVCQSVIARLTKAAEAKGLLIFLEGDASVFLTADAKRLQEALESLVHNSVMYTAEGFVSLYFQATETDVTFFVRDSGRGIHADDIPKLFNRFESLGENREAQVGMGAGLGLAIAKDLIQLHGGEISLSSQLGEGTCVQFRLPKNALPLTTHKESP